ncbi:hypothetical protein A2696_02190 [Candidatus Curtissbacteria bacterium RIFCSPHIGHO2_01_FULL_41_13]|uniref:Trigger factor n=1 Tax=Candidatus Curtissbacteria bacterium RIFCSPHIGHO2_01_FULL_41_13 TaxID=1797745 RepID=A0A1F5G277_9BACT|nr:MAG: hypothetical protein A2696_02190 [Candidatus Curtissbacteria bacterium RIFCSPHIGHO2_01_FULL_41_13]
MQYTVNRGEKGKIEIKVDIPKAAFDEAYEKVLVELGKETNVAGFRPGNVPKDVLEAKIGTNKILNEAASFLISKHLSDIFKKENISPLGSPSVAVHSLAKDAPFSFTATVISKPKVKVGDWKKIKVKRVAAKEVGEKDVSESIKNIYEAWLKNSKFKDQKSKSDEENENQTGKKFIYDAHGNKLFFKGDTESSKGPKEPKVDDEFVKAIGARDLAHLREIVKKDLEQIVADQVEAKLENEIYEQVLKISEVEVPDILVDDEVNRIMVRLNSQLEQQDRKLDDYLREQNTTLEALRAKFKPQAEKNVKVTLIMDEIGKSEKVQVGREEIDNALKNINQADLKEDQKKDLEQYLAVSLFQAKTLDLVKKALAA